MSGINPLTLKDLYREAVAAQKRIRPYVRETPLEESLFLGQQGNCRVFLKLENFQLTGSFKLRGAFNRLLTLASSEKEKGVITASSGNHGIALTYAAQQLGVHSTVVVPEKLSPAKKETLQHSGAHVIFHGKDAVDAEAFARQRARNQGKIYISPYNDPMIIAGQATVGLEILKQIKKIDAVLVPIGGGGLMSGIVGSIKSQYPGTRLIGCQPRHSPVMAESVKAGHIVRCESKPTLADGSAGGIEENSLTFPLCRDHVDDYILVSEEEIQKALLIVLDKVHLLIEGAAALPVASFLKEGNRLRDKHVVLVISGRKIHLDTLKMLLCSG